MLFILRTSPGACAEHMDACTTVHPGTCGDVMLSVCKWTGANRSSSSALPSPQEPSLDPRTILELPLGEAGPEAAGRRAQSGKRPL